MRAHNEQEKEMQNTLEGLNGYIALSLRPEIGQTTINKNGNRAFINEGRQGKFLNISDAFYMDMVYKFDSRS